jgi:hypothetical protein
MSEIPWLVRLLHQELSAGALKISVLVPDFFLRPKRRLNGASSFILYPAVDPPKVPRTIDW